MCQAFSKFWLVFWISAFRSMLRRWTSRNKYINIKISLHNFICYYSRKFWRNLTKIGPIYKIVRVVFLPKSNARFKLIKVRKRLNEKKNAKSAEEQDNELTDSYQNYDLSWYLHKEKETSFFHIMYGKFCKFCKVRDVKDEPHHERLPQKLPQGTHQGLRLWHFSHLLTFYLKVGFSE